MHYIKLLLSKKPSHTLLAGCALLVIMLILLTLGMPAIERQLDRWGMLPRHQQLTELAIITEPKLPTTYKSGESQTVNFAVRNQEGRSIRYTSVARIQNQDGSIKQQLGSQTFTLASGEARTFHATGTTNDLGKHAYLSVTLSTGEQVGYWVEQK